MRIDNQTFHLIFWHRSCRLPTCHFIYLNNLPQTQKTHTRYRYRYTDTDIQDTESDTESVSESE